VGPLRRPLCRGWLSRFDDWCIDDPTGKDAATVRYIRDAIDRRVGKLLHRLGVATAGPGATRFEVDGHQRWGAGEG
jgi:hypothetical protein